jgi:hypothetical protein
VSPRSGLDVVQRQQISDLVKASLDQTKRRLPAPELHTGTVLDATPGQSATISVKLGSPEAPVIYPQNITSQQFVPGQRVVVLMAQEGAFVIGSYDSQASLIGYDYNTSTVFSGASTAWFSSNMVINVTFPPSGKVRIKFNGLVYSNGAGAGFYMELRVWDQTNGAMVGDSLVGATTRATTTLATQSQFRVHWEHVVQELTPGASARWELQFRCTSIPTDSGISAGVSGGMPRFEVWAEPAWPGSPG